MTAKEKFIEDCYQQYYEFLWNLCRKKVACDPIYLDLVNTCIQDTFLLAYQSYDSVVHHENIRAWLTRTCLNRLLPYAQLQRKRMEHEAYSLDDPEKQKSSEPFQYGISEALEDNEATGFIDEFLPQLSEQERNVFNSYFLEQLPLIHIAAIQDCSIGAIKSTIHRIRKKAKKMNRHTALPAMPISFIFSAFRYTAIKYPASSSLSIPAPFWLWLLFH